MRFRSTDFFCYSCLFPFASLQKMPCIMYFIKTTIKSSRLLICLIAKGSEENMSVLFPGELGHELCYLGLHIRSEHHTRTML